MGLLNNTEGGSLTVFCAAASLVCPAEVRGLRDQNFAPSCQDTQHAKILSTWMTRDKGQMDKTLLKREALIQYQISFFLMLPYTDFASCFLLLVSQGKTSSRIRIPAVQRFFYPNKKPKRRCRLVISLTLLTSTPLQSLLLLELL